MGYKPSKRAYSMTFVDHPGLEVTATGASLGKMMELGRMEARLDMPEEEQLKVFTFFASRLVTWNIEHPDLEDSEYEVEEGQEVVCGVCGSPPGLPLPTTVKGMLCLEPEFIMAIITGWMSAVAQVSGPKGLSTNDGGMTTQMTEQLMSQLGKLQSPTISPMQSSYLA